MYMPPYYIILKTVIQRVIASSWAYFKPICTECDDARRNKNVLGGMQTSKKEFISGETEIAFNLISGLPTENQGLAWFYPYMQTWYQVER